MRAAAVILPLLALAGCGSGNDQPGPGGVTTAENKALDDAAGMIEQQRLPAEALRTPTQAPAAVPSVPAK